MVALAGCELLPAPREAVRWFIHESLHSPFITENHHLQKGTSASTNQTLLQRKFKLSSVFRWKPFTTALTKPGNGRVNNRSKTRFIFNASTLPEEYTFNVPTVSDWKLIFRGRTSGNGDFVLRHTTSKSAGAMELLDKFFSSVNSPDPYKFCRMILRTVLHQEFLRI